MNNYLVLVFTQKYLSSVPVAMQVFMGRANVFLCDFSLTKEAIIKEIDKIRKTKLPDPNDIHQDVLNEAKNILSDSLANIFRISLDAGIELQIYKRANVVPIFKKRDKSITSVTARLV